MFKRLLAIPTAILGVLLSHEITYSLLTNSDAAKHALLDSTGHSWRNSYPQIITFTVLGLIFSSYVEINNSIKKLNLFKIFLYQEAAFLAIEFGERALSHDKILPATGILLLGSALQLPAALFIKFLLKYVVEAILVGLNRSGEDSKKIVARIKQLTEYNEPTLKRIFSYAQQPRSPTINI